MSYVFRPFLVFMATASIFSSTVLPAGSDDSLSQAAAQFREKNYGVAYALLGKNQQTPQRFFLAGVAALRGGRAAEAVPLLSEAELKLPIVADYAALYLAEALMKLKRYPEAAEKASSIAKSYPASQLLRRSEKLHAEILFENADYKGALKGFQAYMEKYPTGADSIDALYYSARCREELGNQAGAVSVYRSIWINNPTAPQAQKARERLQELDKTRFKAAPFSVEELLKRASYQYSHNDYSDALNTLDSIDLKSQPKDVVARVELKTGMAYYRLRKYKLAEKQFARVLADSQKGISSEARFWTAKALERQGQNDQALAIYLELASGGKKQEYSVDALLEAAGLKRSLGQYAAAARLYEQALKLANGAKTLSKTSWDAAWCSYLSGDMVTAIESFKGLLKDDTQREKVLYWLGRSHENGRGTESTSWYNQLLEEFPSGFYAAWYREQKGVPDSRETLGTRNVLAEMPQLGGFEKPRLLASLGMAEEARSEMQAARKKAGEKKGLNTGLARIYLEMGDYRSAISLFAQNPPTAWEKETLPLWAVGYPLAYSGLVRQNALENSLSEGLVYALIRSESSFVAAIKSPAGAIGLMQMMPATARQVAKEKGDFNPQRLTVPEYNIKLGTKHMQDLMHKYNGDVVHVAAAYNAGSGALERWRMNLKGLKKDEFIESIPYQETRDYVKKVFASAATYRQLYGIK